MSGRLKNLTFIPQIISYCTFWSRRVHNEVYASRKQIRIHCASRLVTTEVCRENVELPASLASTYSYFCQELFSSYIDKTGAYPSKSSSKSAVSWKQLSDWVTSPLIPPNFFLNPKQKSNHRETRVVVVAEEGMENYCLIGAVSILQDEEFRGCMEWW